MSSGSRSSVDQHPASPSSLPATDSTSRLILLPNTDDNDSLEEYIADDEDNNEDNDPQPGVNQLHPPLPPSVVFLYLLSPYLRLGAIYASDIGNISLTYGLTGLVVAAALSAFCRQIWFLLGRYLRKSSTEDMLIYIFARRRRRVLKHGLARYTFTIISGLFRLLLAAMYLRDSVRSALLLKIPELTPSLSPLTISIALSIPVFVLSLPRSLGSKTIVYTTGLSVASYLAWLVALSRSYPSLPNLSSSQRGVLWNEISSFAFACTTAMTVPLSASMIAGTPPVPHASRNARARSFQLLNVFSTMLAALLIFPLVVIAASPRAPKASTVMSDNILLGLRIATLVLSIPSVVVSITSLPLHGVAYRFIRTDLALSVITIVIFALSLVPPTIASILDDVMLFVAVFAAFLLPGMFSPFFSEIETQIRGDGSLALAHITIHYFRRPLSIVVPQARPSPSTPRRSNFERSPSPSRNPLLQRKERHLQRRRFGKRLLWDVAIWTVLLPICVCALVWAVGRLGQRW
ncbi:hypothetical protein L210DRAFT_3143309 [Boletus edulis BED1]|uniref:Uncharacterized protein n=1 Tax=Boletus edulis BED1 TaxID=1328754 RepID=A0AAD4GG13_BOLED|nr:hypothetical protein L210DRAFT_3143309 [Boletus edulis BED1]